VRSERSGSKYGRRGRLVGGSAVGGLEGERRGLNLCVVPSPNGRLSLSIWERIEIERVKWRSRGD
jgi:hypothetical protein